jgi:hypothetical protein
MEIQQLSAIASQVRRDIVRMVSAVNSGHPGGSLGCADFLTVLYFHQMKHNPDHFTMDGIDEDLFFQLKNWVLSEKSRHVFKVTLVWIKKSLVYAWLQVL